jgi:hypothetical protein
MTDEIHRHPDGSIDFDFYRIQATALRGQAMRDAATLRLASAGAVVMAGALGFALVIPSAVGAVRDHVASVWPVSSHIR